MIIRRNAAEFHIMAPLTMVIPTSKAKLMGFAKKSIAASKTWLEKHTTQAGGPRAQNVASLTMMYFSNPVKALNFGSRAPYKCLSLFEIKTTPITT